MYDTARTMSRATANLNPSRVDVCSVESVKQLFLLLIGAFPSLGQQWMGLWAQLDFRSSRCGYGGFARDETLVSCVGAANEE
jgi:hypothetical protein